jgi:serine protease DegQ
MDWKTVFKDYSPFVFEINDGQRHQTALAIFDGVLVSTSHKFNNENPEVHGEVSGKAELIGFDNSYDLAFFSFKEAKGLPEDWIADDPAVGDEIRSLARHQGNLEVTGGMVQYLRDYQELPSFTKLEPAIGIDGNLPYGFSGGALVHESGKFLGVNSSWPRGMGMTVPYKTVKEVYEKVKKGGGKNKRKLGIQPHQVPIALKQGDDESIRQGILVSQLETGSPAEKAGLVTGDVLISANGKELHSMKMLFALLHHGSEDEIEFELIRSGEIQTVKVQF